MTLKTSKKGYTLVDIPWLAIILGIGIIITSVMTSVVSSVRETQCTINSSTNGCVPGTTTNESFISEKGMLAMVKLSNWFPTIGLVLGAVIVIVALSALFIFNK